MQHNEEDSFAPEEYKIAQAIEHEIIFGLLPPGAPLREETIAKRYSASRHHVRSALMQLERAGIVAHERNKGARVQAYSPPEVERLYDVREMLTRQATLKITLPVSTEAIAAVQAVQDAFEQAVEKNDLQAIHKTNDAFHIAFFSLCDNPFLVDLLKRSMDMTYVIRAANTSNVKRQAVSCGEHQSMIAMLSGTDSWALSELCVRHLRPSKVAYLERVQAEKVTKKNRRVQ